MPDVEPGGGAVSRAMPYLGPIALIAAIVVVAFFVNRYAPQKRRHVRRAAVLALLYLVTAAALLVPPLFGAVVPLSTSVRAVSELLAAFAGVTVAGIVVFDLALPALRVNLANIVTDLVMGLAYVASTLAIVRRAGVDLTGIVATSAVVTGILALSMQATLGNVIGGVALQMDQSIRVGDWIQLENGKQGRVRAIRWRHTVVETRDWDTLIVPNASLLAANILILGKREGEPTQHRMWVNFNVDFRYAPADVIRAVQQALRAAPIEGVSAHPPPDCICRDFAGEARHSFSWYSVRYWLTDLARDDPTSSRVRERIYAALKRAEIPLAVPAAHLWIEQDSSERRERKEKRDLDQRINALRAVEFLVPLTPAELREIATHLHYAPFAAGETITRQGAVAHWLYVLEEGSVEVAVAADNGGEQVVAKLTGPTFFGEMGLMTGSPRTATVRASTDVACYRLEKEAFHSVLRERPEVATEISALLAKREVELHAARGHLDAAAKQRKVEAERTRILSTIQDFFGLDA